MNQLTTDELKVIKENFDAIQSAMDTGMSTMIPVARQYLVELREVRMAFDREILEIMCSVRQLSEITKNNEQFKELAVNLSMIDKALSNNLKEKIISLFNI